MLTAMFVVAVIALVFFAGAVATVFVGGKNHPAITMFGLVAVLNLLALAVLAIVTFFVGP